MDAMHSIQPRYNFGRAIKRVTVGVVAIIALLALLFWLGSVFNDWSKFREDRNGYLGISIGASMDEAFYVFGTPQTVFGETENEAKPRGSEVDAYVVDGSDPVHRLPSGKGFRDFDFWNVPRDGIDVGLRFDAKTKRLIGIRCSRTGPEDTAQCPWIYSVGPYENEQEIVKGLGPADAQSYEGLTKLLDWNRIGLQMRFQKQKPYIITKTASGRPGLWWFIAHQVL